MPIIYAKSYFLLFIHIKVAFFATLFFCFYGKRIKKFFE
jgi:hypothetical protein